MTWARFIWFTNPMESRKRYIDRQNGIDFPETHIEGFQRIREQGHLVRREGPVMRISVGVPNQLTSQDRDVISVVALNTNTVDVVEILTQITIAVSEASDQLPEVSQVSASLGNANP